MKCILRALNASKCVCGRGSARDCAGGAYRAPQASPRWIGAIVREDREMGRKRERKAKMKGKDGKGKGRGEEGKE